ncbi:Leukotriene A-4 hydrolase-like protein [Smittium mucronatum]|uniref:Leukotriene A-4 hydrolase-like protein n=1 Tax=Smittium mucronatum TaxID=133383 RepID=A0A1R0H202_9FUNG|nr:Leukotriene A-4 hydrolase-like protein [Smittium mucronatum]
MNSVDPNSLSNLDEIITRNVHLDLTVDFDRKLLHGFVILTLDSLIAGVSQVVLDTNGLSIASVFECSSEEDLPLEFALSDEVEFYGSALTIKLRSSRNEGDKFDIKINYQTTDSSASLQFLTPQQTKGKKYPFLFTQCQSIYARSMFPCQDSPSVKIVYTANLRTPKPLIGLMSAISTGSKDEGESSVFTFKQNIPIPSYLVVIAAGDLRKHDLGPRTAVWAEPEMIDACKYEFKDLEHIVSVGESLITPYVWGRYDLLVLPPSFPYGGMENPCLTFVTPTMIAGDRSLVDLISHELAHSWSGNLVTTRNWEHFWLNEGWTTFFERQITAELSGRPMSQLLSILGIKSLYEDVVLMGKDNVLTNLVPNLKGIHPDDAFSSVPYEKGYNMLYYLKELLGHSFWDSFSRSYILKFSNKSIDTNDFKKYLYERVEVDLGEKGMGQLESVDWDHWFHKPGMPPVENNFDNSLQIAAISLANKWCSPSSDYASFKKSEFDSLYTHQKLVFFSELKDRLEKQKSGDNSGMYTDLSNPKLLEAMDSLYQLSYTGNFEVRAGWLYYALTAHYKGCFNAAVGMVEDQGRMKFTRPTYRLLNKCVDEGGDKLAKETFLRLELTYHPICSRLVRKDLGL